MKTAIIYDWLVAQGGAEKVLHEVRELFPSPIYTLVADKRLLKDQNVITSFLQHLPRAARWYRHYLPLFPLAIEQFDLASYDCILSLSHAVAKGVLIQPDQLHLCYCFTPMRYLWDQYHLYLKHFNFFSRLLARPLFHSLRKWDYVSAARVDHFAAISSYVAQRIAKIYRRESTVIYPPVNTSAFQPAAQREEFYLTLSRLVPYKRVDLIVEAFAHLPRKKLLVIGDGPEMYTLKAKATPNVEFLGAQKDAVVKDLMGKAKAFIYAAIEDFGIVLVEAQAAGTPVIALKKGGALETVIDKTTGLFFDKQTVDSLIDAIASFEKIQDQFDPQVIQTHAEQFSTSVFKKRFHQFVTEKVAAHVGTHLSRG